MLGMLILKIDIMKNIYFLLTLGFIISTGLNAQQDPHYTQYMYNMNVVNPAYAGSKENLAVGLLYRTQWTSINGAPKTGTFAIHSPVTDKVGLGLSAITDQIGPVDETNVYADFSYTLNLGGEHKLAFGIKAGATFHKVGLYSDIGNSYLPQPNDPAFSENISNTYINIGTGAFYYTNKYYVALSVPNLLKSKHLDITQNGQELEFGSETQHYFITAGYVFNLTENTKFKPSFLLKSAFEAPTSLDVSANFLFYDKLEIGGTYRLDDAVGGLINFAVTPSLRIGYAYDHIVSDLDVATSASHEFLLLFDVNFAKKVSISPRFF